MSRGRALSAVLLLFLSGIRAAPLQDANDDAVHSVVENLKQVLSASRNNQVAQHEEPDVLPIVDVELGTPSPQNASETDKPAPTIPVTLGTVSPNPVTTIADKVLIDEHPMDRSDNNSSHFTIVSISDKVHPIGDAHKNEEDAGTSIRVISYEDPESTEQGGGRRGVPVDSQEHGEGEAHALLHEAPVSNNKPPPGDKIEDVEMLDGSVPTKLGVNVNINKLVGDGSVSIPSFDVAAVQELAGLVPQDHVPEIPNNAPESDVATTTYATTDGLIDAETTEAPKTTTYDGTEATTAPTTEATAATERADISATTDFESLLNVPAVETYPLPSDVSSTQQPPNEATTAEPQTTTYEPTTEKRPTTTAPQETTQTFQFDVNDEQLATTEPSTTPSVPDQTEGSVQEATTVVAPSGQSLSEENVDKITAVHDDSVRQNDESNDIAVQSTKLPDVLESTVIPTTDVPSHQFTSKPVDEAVTTKADDSYEDSVAEEDIIRPLDSLPERFANKTDETDAGKKEFTTSSPVTEPAVAAVVTERADAQNGGAGEESSESQEESQEANEESHETNEQEQSGESGEQTGETVEGETSETVDQTGETSELTVGQTDSTVRPVTVEIATQVTETSSSSVSTDASSEASGEILPPIVVKQLSAHSQVSLRYARTLVDTQLRNDAKRTQEARITVELPDDAFITGMTIESNGQVYQARVAERQAANQQYQEAVQHGQSAAQVVASGRNTNVFSVLVSVEPQQILGVNLTYEELLTRRRGRYRHTLTLRADQEIERTEMEVLLIESRNLTALAVYAGDRQLISAEDRELALAGLSDRQAGLLHVKRQTWKSAVVSLKAVGSQQQELWGTSGAPHQIAVEYDVDRGGVVAGDLLLMDGYFVHFFAPPDLPPLRKHAILVLDTSGSMWGRKLRQVQQAMGRILDSLHPDDYFSIIQFASQVTEWSPHTLEVVGLREKEATLPATKEHISKAKKFISSMEASGGTNIGGALRSALKLAFRRDFDRWAGHGGSTGSPPQPLIIFLSDGLPTVGTLSANRILAATRAANGELRASIFSLSFGSRANWRFLQKISLQNHGFARRVYEAGDAAQQLHDFYREISSPLLTNVTFNYIVLKVNKTTVTKRHFPLLCDGSEIVVAGRYSPGGENQLLEAEVEGWGGPEGSAAVEGAAPQKLLFRAQAQNISSQDISGLVPPPKRQAEPDPKMPGLLERLWAYLSIRQLLDRDMAEGADALSTNNSLPADGPHGTGPADDTPRLRALYLALKYNFVTPLTSLVVVKPSNKPGGGVTETLTDPASDQDGVADESAAHAEDFPMQNKISEMNLAKPGPDLPISFKPLLLGEDQTLNLDDIRWLSKHMDPLGRLLVNGTAYNLTLPTDEELALANATAAEQCQSIRSCQPLAKCVQAAFVDSYTIFADYFCALGRWAGVCCPAT